MYRESPGKFDSRTLSRKSLNRWTGRSSALGGAWWHLSERLACAPGSTRVRFRAPFARGFALQSFSRDCSPAPDLVLLKAYLPRSPSSAEESFFKPCVRLVSWSVFGWGRWGAPPPCSWSRGVVLGEVGGVRAPTPPGFRPRCSGCVGVGFPGRTLRLGVLPQGGRHCLTLYRSAGASAQKNTICAAVFARGDFKGAVQWPRQRLQKSGIAELRPVHILFLFYFVTEGCARRLKDGHR